MNLREGRFYPEPQARYVRPRIDNAENRMYNIVSALQVRIQEATNERPHLFQLRNWSG